MRLSTFALNKSNQNFGGVKDKDNRDQKKAGNGVEVQRQEQNRL